tara:strand:- start:963 stop:1193 length:231 start_codon:yes stop_codon:yes gene_type:complete
MVLYFINKFSEKGFVVASGIPETPKYPLRSTVGRFMKRKLIKRNKRKLTYEFNKRPSLFEELMQSLHELRQLKEEN